jgi:hypothetical protein
MQKAAYMRLYLSRGDQATGQARCQASVEGDELETRMHHFRPTLDAMGVAICGLVYVPNPAWEEPASWPKSIEY